MQREKGYQRHPRYTKRLEVTFRSGILSYRGILSNLSENGLFIRTNRSFGPGTIVDIELVMPDNKVSLLKGIVRRSLKTALTTMKNGMGIELIEKDATYINFVKSFRGENETGKEKPPAQELQIISCPGCGVQNKVLTERLSLGPKCGKCGTPLPVTMP